MTNQERLQALFQHLEEIEAYYRVLAKLDGSFEPDQEGRDYSDVYAQYS